MIQDLRRVDSGFRVNADLCIIGGGAAGITIASHFIGTNLQVCLVESGGEQFEPDTQSLYAGKSIGHPVNMEVGRLRELGGSTNHWGGRCAEFSAAEWAQRDWVPHSGWPIELAELRPHYRMAWELCGIPPDSESDGELLQRIGVPQVPDETDQVATQIWRIAPDSGAGTWSFRDVWRSKLQKSGNIKVFLHANLVGFDISKSLGHVNAINVRSLTGIAATIVAEYFVLCCSGIENARLLLAASPLTPQGLGCGHSQVGRYFMQHLRASAALVAPSHRQSMLQDAYNDIIAPGGLKYETGLSLGERLQRNKKLLNASAVLLYNGDPNAGSTAAQEIWRQLRAGRWSNDLGTKVWDIVRDLGSLERNLERRYIHGRHPLLSLESALIVVDLEQTPNPDSRVTLGTERDQLGVPRVVIDWRYSDQERDTAREFMFAIEALFVRRGLGRLRLGPWLTDNAADWSDAVGETFHYIGTTRMSDGPETGVVDRDCRVWGVDNLFIAGSSVFPTGGHVNPTLTLIALASRLAMHLDTVLGNQR